MERWRVHNYIDKQDRETGSEEGGKKDLDWDSVTLKERWEEE